VELCGVERKHEAYDVVCERGPGNPLFSTSFARLALGPTLHSRPSTCFFFSESLRATTTVFADDSPSKPALRSRDFPPALAVSNSHTIRRGVLRGWCGKLSCAALRLGPDEAWACPNCEREYAREPFTYRYIRDRSMSIEVSGG
jgi:hypothetical protein